MDDDCSWLLFHGHGDGGTDSEHSYGCAGRLHEEQDVAISLQVQQQLNQICMLMDREEHGYADAVPASSSSTFPSSGSLDENSSLMLTGSSTTTTSCHNHPVVEVSSLQIPLSPIAYDDHHGLFYGNLDTLLDDPMERPRQEHVQRRNDGHAFGGAFRPYTRHLSPRKKPKQGASGQRAIKNAMSALERMHRARLAQWQSIQMEMAAARSSVGSNFNQLQVQHVLSERKRREKLNDSFKALGTVLPPGPKKDRASMLIRARDYVNTLKSRVSELERKNRMLVESPLHSDNGGGQDDYSREQIEVDITDKAAAETPHEFRLNIIVGSGWNAMDAVFTILQCVNKEIGDVRLVAMHTRGSSSIVLPPGKDFQIATLTLQVTSSRCDTSLLKESVLKTVKDAMKSDDRNDLSF